MKALVLRCALTSLQGGAAALAVFAVCAVLRRLRAPSRVLCWLWLAVGLRFLLPGIPVTLPRPRSAPLVKAAAAVQALTAPVQTASGPVLPTAPAGAAAAGAAANTAAPWYAGITVWHFLAAAWAAGTLALLALAAFRCRRLTRRVALAYKTDDGCFTAPEVTNPFTLGILRPRIYLPADLQGPERRAVLRHERTHIARGDTVTKPLFYAVACLHWWDPLAWLAFAQFERTMECACDEAAVRGLPPERRRDYGESILRFAALPRRQVPGSLAFSRGRVKERVERVLRYRRPGRRAVLGCALAALLTAAVCMVRPTVADAVPPPTNDAPAAADTAAQPAPETAAPSPAPAAPADRAPQETAGYFALYEGGGPLPPRYFTGYGAPGAGTAPDGAAYETLAAVQPAVTGLVFPVESYTRFTAPFGPGHTGLDIAAPSGTQVYAAADGTVTEAGYDHENPQSKGNFVRIAHAPTADGQTQETLYCHLDSYAVTVGDSVKAGQVIGTVGASGYTFGPHLHFELLQGGVPADPAPCLPDVAPAPPAE